MIRHTVTVDFIPAAPWSAPTFRARCFTCGWKGNPEPRAQADRAAKYHSDTAQPYTPQVADQDAVDAMAQQADNRWHAHVAFRLIAKGAAAKADAMDRLERALRRLS